MAFILSCSPPSLVSPCSGVDPHCPPGIELISQDLMRQYTSLIVQVPEPRHPILHGSSQGTCDLVDTAACRQKTTS